MRSAFFIIGVAAMAMILLFVIFSFTDAPRPSDDTRDLLEHLNAPSASGNEVSGPHIP